MRFQRLISLLLVLLLCVSLLAGCGKPSAQEEKPTEAPAPAEETKPEAPTEEAPAEEAPAEE